MKPAAGSQGAINVEFNDPTGSLGDISQSKGLVARVSVEVLDQDDNDGVDESQAKKLGDG